MKIIVVDQKGKEHTIDATIGWTAMESIRAANLELRAECGGACSCATCHIYVDPAWRDKLPPPVELEVEMLDMAFEVKDESRLSCQITLEPEHEGIRLTLAPGTE